MDSVPREDAFREYVLIAHFFTSIICFLPGAVLSLDALDPRKRHSLAARFRFDLRAHFVQDVDALITELVRDRLFVEDYPLGRRKPLAGSVERVEAVQRHFVNGLFTTCLFQLGRDFPRLRAVVGVLELVQLAFAVLPGDFLGENSVAVNIARRRAKPCRLFRLRRLVPVVRLGAFGELLFRPFQITIRRGVPHVNPP